MKFHVGSLENVENREHYRAGRYHPTQIGDKYHSERYQTIHKLGYGSFAAIWLAHDTKLNMYVALKIVAAEVSQDCKELEIFQYVEKLPASVENTGRYHVIKLIGNFWIERPNGRHLCLVLPVLGPSITCSQELKDKTIKQCYGSESGTSSSSSFGILAFPRFRTWR